MPAEAPTTTTRRPSSPATGGLPHQLGLEDLADLVAGQLVDRHEPHRHLVGRQVGPARGDQLVVGRRRGARGDDEGPRDRKSTRLNSSHVKISYAVFCLKKKNIN